MSLSFKCDSFRHSVTNVFALTPCIVQIYNVVLPHIVENLHQCTHNGQVMIVNPYLGFKDVFFLANKSYFLALPGDLFAL